MAFDHTGWIDRARAPESPKPLASKFADWVFQNSVRRLDAQPLDEDFRRQRLQLGKITHRDIELFLQVRWTREFLGKSTLSDWSVFFADSGTQPTQIFQASRLRIKASPIRCVPDVVLKNESLNKFLIIERKTTFVPEPDIPVNGWPNVEAQLWCYSWIDDFDDAAEVLLVGQLWHRTRGGISLCHRHPSWKRSDVDHHERCLKWFNKYGGSIG